MPGSRPPTKPASLGSGPKISVIVTAYNAAEFLRDSVGSVLGQTYPNVECLVIDDGSTDPTRRVAKELQRKDSRVRYFRKPNGGAASARNFGFDRATGEWMQTLDADDWIAPDKLERQLAAAGRVGRSGEGILVYSDYEMVFEDENHRIVKRAPAVIGPLLREELLRNVIGRRFGLATPSPLTMNSMLLSGSLCKQHRFNESIRCAEDLEYYYRILNARVRCIYVPMCSMSYRQRANSLSKDKHASLIGYTDFLETIFQNNPDDLVYFPNLHKMIRRTYEFRDGKTLERLRRILIRSRIPVYIRVRNRMINVRGPVAAAYRTGFWRLGANAPDGSKVAFEH